MPDAAAHADPKLVAEVRTLLQATPRSLDQFMEAEGTRAAVPAEVQEVATVDTTFEHPQGIVGWIWEQFARVAKHVICGPDVYNQLVAISKEQIRAKIDELLDELIGRITEQVPAWLRPLIPLVRPIVAQAIAYELHTMLNDGLTTYCAVPA